MATYDSALGMWKSKQGRYYSSEMEAKLADGVDGSAAVNADFFDEGLADQGAAAPVVRDPDAAARRQLDADSRKPRDLIRTTNPAGDLGPSFFAAGGAYSNLPSRSRAQYDYMHELGSDDVVLSPRTFMNRMGEKAGVSHVGDVGAPRAAVHWSPEAMFMDTYQRTTDPERGLGTTIGGTGGLPVTSLPSMGFGASGAAESGGGSSSVMPGFTQGEGRANVDEETSEAKENAQDVIEENRDENSRLFADAFANYENLGESDYALGDEARGYQREALQQQRSLLERMLGFDADQYASRYADQALSRQIAAGRSAGGGYASQQAGMMAALEQGPALYAEGARQASALETQRLQGAQAVAKTFGDIATMTRGQDEQRSQFESNLGLSIADSVARLTEGNVQMNDRESQQMAQIWMDFAKLQSVYEGMTSDEQLAWWQNETARRGQDKNFEAIMANLKASGSISSKDLIGGLFQLGGGLITTGGTLGAAYIGRPQAPQAAA
jgi:hypothetical protein